MQFAYDELRKLISAPSARHYKIYFCPACDKQVSARSLSPGNLRIPYFAHLRGVTNSECENYNPSSWVSNPQRTRDARRIPSHIPYGRQSRFLFQGASGASNHSISSKNLYLKYEDDWHLYFSISFKKSTNRWSGSVLVNGEFGQTEINYQNSDGKFNVRVPFKFSEDSIETIGYVDEAILTELKNDFPTLQTSEFSFFMANDTSGRLLSQNESLRFNQYYCLLNSTLIPNDVSKYLSLNLLGEISGYQINEICINEEISLDAKEILEDFFEKKIEFKRPEIVLLSPLPNGIEVDGTVLIPDTSEFLMLEVSASTDDVLIKAIGGFIDETNINYIENIVEINLKEISGVTIYWRNTIILTVHKRNHLLQKFDSLMAQIDDGNSIDLLDKKSISSLAVGSVISIISPHYFPRKKIIFKTVQGEKSLPDIFQIQDGDVIDGRPFGFASFGEYPELSQIQPAVRSIYISQRAARIAKLLLNQKMVHKGLVVSNNSSIAKVFPYLLGIKISNKYLAHLRLLEKIVIERENHDT
jgi:hypothetical protein